jgi:hypothetical protein
MGFVKRDRCGGSGLVGDLVAEHGVQDVAAASGEADEGGERGEEERAFEVLVAASGWVLAADAAAGSSGNWSAAGVGGEVTGGGEGGAVADFEQGPGGGPDADAGHRGQDRGKRVRIKHPLNLAGDVVALSQDVAEAVGEAGQDRFRLKRAFFLAAFASLADPVSRAYYDRKRAEGKRHNAALICLARRRCDVLFAMLRDKIPYQPRPTAA